LSIAETYSDLLTGHQQVHGDHVAETITKSDASRAARFAVFDYGFKPLQKESSQEIA
jgi:hypothetical protein